MLQASFWPPYMWTGRPVTAGTRGPLRGRRGNRMRARARKLRAQGLTYKQIGERFRPWISRQRVAQLLGNGRD